MQKRWCQRNAMSSAASPSVSGSRYSSHWKKCQILIIARLRGSMTVLCQWLGQTCQIIPSIWPCSDKLVSLWVTVKLALLDIVSLQAWKSRGSSGESVQAWENLNSLPLPQCSYSAWIINQMCISAIRLKTWRRKMHHYLRLWRN